MMPAARRKLRRPAALVAGALLLMLLMAACSSRNSASPAPVVTVQTAPVVRTTLEQWVEAEGVLYPLHQAIITPKITAPIERFFVNRGDRVRKGQLLALLENRDLQAATAENRGLYQQAQAGYQTAIGATLPQQMQQAQLDLTAAQRNLDAQQKIYDSRKVLFQQGAIARRDLETAGVTLVQARNQYEIARKHLQALEAFGSRAQKQAAAGQLAAAQGRYQGAQAQLHYSQVRSPLDGVVTDRPLYPGQEAGAGTPLVTVMDLSKVTARIHIAPDQAALIKPGDQAELVSPGGLAVPAQVQLVSPAVDPGSTTVEVWVQAENPKLLLRAGATVRVRILVRSVPQAMVIPSVALLSSDDGGAFVMRVGSDGLAHQVTVTPGVKAAGQLQILKGLQPGDQVITVGAYGLPDGTRIRVANGTTSGQGGQS